MINNKFGKHDLINAEDLDDENIDPEIDDEEKEYEEYYDEEI